MLRNSVLVVLAISICWAAPVSAEMRSLDDRQLDLVTAGINQVVNASEGRVIGQAGLVNNSVAIGQSAHALTIRDARVEIRSVLTTVGDTNATVTGLNALVGVGRAPGSPRNLNSNSLGFSRGVSQLNVVGLP